jgi:hypothetical protein
MSDVTVMFVCDIPTIKGQNVTWPTRALAEREAKNAAKIGHAASVIEVLVRQRPNTRAVSW